MHILIKLHISVTVLKCILMLSPQRSRQLVNTPRERDVSTKLKIDLKNGLID